VDDQLERARLTANSTVSIERLPVGRHLVILRDVAPNCVIQGDSSRAATIEAEDQVVDVTFTGTCVRLGGVRVTVVTTGSDPDPDGYSIALLPVSAPYSGAQQVTTSAAATFTRVAPGGYRVQLGGVAANCGVAGVNPRAFTVPSGDTVGVSVEVACAPVTRLAFAAATPDGDIAIYAVNSNGTGVTRLTTGPGVNEDPVWSPDGARIAFTSNRDGARAVHVMDADGSNPVRLTDPAVASHDPAWSPDGRRIVFVSERDGNPELYVMNADGTGQVRLTNDAARDVDPAWSPDGRRIAFASGRGGGTQLYVMNADGSGVERLTTSDTEDRHPAWSPDGGRLAFSRVRCPDTGRNCYPTVFVLGPSGVPTEVGLGDDPAWSSDGTRIAVTAVTCESGYDGLFYGVTVCRLGGGLDVLLASGDPDLGVSLSVSDPQLIKGFGANPSWRW
jgi:WD40 repeat protein